MGNFRAVNIGLDACFLDNRLGFNFDWYKKTTKDWLVQAPLNDILSYEEAAYINGDDVENKGIEVAFSWNDRIGKDFSYHVGVNMAYNKNEVTRLATSSGKIGTNVSSALFENSSYVSLVEQGHPVGYFSGMSYSGIWLNYDPDYSESDYNCGILKTTEGFILWPYAINTNGYQPTKFEIAYLSPG